MKKGFFPEAFNRLTSDVPAFFKKLQVIGVGIGGLGTAFATIHNVPAKLAAIGSTFIWVGATIVAVSQFAQKTTSDENRSPAAK